MRTSVRPPAAEPPPAPCPEAVERRASFSQALETARAAQSPLPPARPAANLAASLIAVEQHVPAGLASLRRRLSASFRERHERPLPFAAHGASTDRQGIGDLLAHTDPAGLDAAGIDPPSLTTSARPANSSRPLALADYPRPVADNGRGLHWVPTLHSTSDVVDRFVQEAADMKAKWVVLLNEGTTIGPNDYLVQQLVQRGIVPIMRIYTPGGGPIQGDLRDLVRHYRALGVQYYQLYNEPNLRNENGGAAPDPQAFVDRWLPAARAVAEAGGLPGFAPLAPGGDYNDIAFLRAALETVKARGETAVFDRAWIGVHNYTLNHPIGYAKDSNGFLKFRWYDRIVREQLGRSLPIIGTEGGSTLGQQEDRTMPAVTEQSQVEMAVDAYRYMRRPEPYYFAYTYWVLANEAGGGTDPAWRDQALFQPNRTSPVVGALRALA